MTSPTPDDPELMAMAEAYGVELLRVCPEVGNGPMPMPNEPVPPLGIRRLTEVLRTLPDAAGIDAFYSAWRAFAASHPEAVSAGDDGFVVVVGGPGWEVVGPPPAPITIDDFYRSLILSGEPVRRARQIATDFEPDVDTPGAMWMGDTLLYVALLSPEHEERIREYLAIDSARMTRELERLRADIAAREAEPKAPVVENYYDYEKGSWVTPETRYRDFASDPKFARLDELISSEPERAWPLLLDLIAAVPEDIDYLAAEGPLESFLAKHGTAFIERIEAQARDNDRFRGCLAECNIPLEIRYRVIAAMRREPWPPGTNS